MTNVNQCERRKFMCLGLYVCVCLFLVAQVLLIFNQSNHRNLSASSLERGAHKGSLPLETNITNIHCASDTISHFHLSMWIKQSVQFRVTCPLCQFNVPGCQRVGVTCIHLYCRSTSTRMDAKYTKASFDL